VTQILEQMRFAGDLLGLLTFSAALVVVVSIPIRAGRAPAPVSKWLLAAGIVLYVLVTASDVAAHIRITELGNSVEDYLETLFPLVALGVAVCAIGYEHEQAVARTRKALSQSHDLMMDIVDGAPAGIMFLDTAGHISFANDAAKEILDLVEDDDSGAITGPGWVVQGVKGSGPGDLTSLLSIEPYDNRPVSLEWPNGWFVSLRVSGRPLSDQRQRVGGIVVTIERV
jgi:PAS domain-containing protein